MAGDHLLVAVLVGGSLAVCVCILLQPELMARTLAACRRGLR